MKYCKCKKPLIAEGDKPTFHRCYKCNCIIKKQDEIQKAIESVKLVLGDSDYAISYENLQTILLVLERYKNKKQDKTCKLQDIYKLLKARPFCNECIHEADLYDAYCLRIIETLEDM